MGTPSSPYTHQHSNMKFLLLLCVFAVCLSSIKAETENEKKCKECCAATTTVAPTTTPGSTTKPGPTSTKTVFLGDTTQSTTTAPKCAGYSTDKECNEKCGAVSFSISVVFVLASVILSLHV